MKHSPDAFATAVALSLVTDHHFTRKAAENAVQAEEKYVRGAHAQGQRTAFAAKRLVEKLHREPARQAKIATVTRPATREVSRAAGLANGSAPCIPFFTPPLFVSPVTGDALERASEEEDRRGQILGGRTKTAHIPSAGLKPGVYSNKDGTSWTKGGAKYVSSSENSKIGAVDTTWVSISSTCVDCDFKTAEVCYAMGGKAQHTAHLMDRAAKEAGDNATATAKNEADCIDSTYRGGAIPEGRFLRLHASGDTSTVAGAKLIAGAIDRWYRRGGAIAYTYTHAWRRVPRTAFGRLSVLASLNPGDDARDALQNGYGSVTALVTNEEWASRMVLTKTGALIFKRLDKSVLGAHGASLDFVPCPAQYPVDAENNKEAFSWKLAWLGRTLGVRENDLEKFVFKLKTGIKFDSEGLPITKDNKAFASIASAAAAAGLPSVHSLEFRTLLRHVDKSEKATCDRCKLCYDDKALGRAGRAIAFRGDKSGGIVKTESLLRNKLQEKIVIAAE